MEATLTENFSKIGRGEEEDCGGDLKPLSHHHYCPEDNNFQWQGSSLGSFSCGMCR